MASIILSTGHIARVIRIVDYMMHLGRIPAPDPSVKIVKVRTNKKSKYDNMFSPKNRLFYAKNLGYARRSNLC